MDSLIPTHGFVPRSPGHGPVCLHCGQGRDFDRHPPRTQEDRLRDMNGEAVEILERALEAQGAYVSRYTGLLQPELKTQFAEVERALAVLRGEPAPAVPDPRAAGFPLGSDDDPDDGQIELLAA